MLIDTHAHINFNAYKDDGDLVIKRALKNDVWMINSGSQKDTSQRAIEYAKKYSEGVYASVALHPIHLASEKILEYLDENETIDFKSREEKFDYDFYKNLASEAKVVAIGETGLEYHHINADKRGLGTRNDADIERQKTLQKEVFIEHLKLARELDKPVVIHCREAYNDVLEILKSFRNKAPLRFAEGFLRRQGFGGRVGKASQPPFNLRGGVSTDAKAVAGEGELKGAVHSFVGRWSQAQQFLEMGFHLGFNGIITFARDYDRVVRETPLERILLETDCPYLTPIPFRGQRNEPLYVKYVAEKIAELKNITFEEVAGQTTKNAKKLFNI